MTANSSEVETFDRERETALSTYRSQLDAAVGSGAITHSQAHESLSALESELSSERGKLIAKLKRETPVSEKTIEQLDREHANARAAFSAQLTEAVNKGGITAAQRSGALMDFDSEAARERAEFMKRHPVPSRPVEDPEHHPHFVATEHRHSMERESMRIAMSMGKADRDTMSKLIALQQRENKVMLHGLRSGDLRAHDQAFVKLVEKAEEHALANGKSTIEMEKDNSWTKAQEQRLVKRAIAGKLSPRGAGEALSPKTRRVPNVRIRAVFRAGWVSGVQKWRLVDQSGRDYYTSPAAGSGVAIKAESLSTLVSRSRNSSQVVTLVVSNRGTVVDIEKGSR